MPKQVNNSKESKQKVDLFIDWNDPKCAITQSMFTSPVPISCGHVFEESAIKEWSSKNDSCPECRKPIGDMPLKADMTILDKIIARALKEKNYSDSLLQHVLLRKLPEEMEILIDILNKQPEKLNKIGIAEEKIDELEIGNFTTLYILASSSEDFFILRNDELREKIDAKALNHIIPLGREKNQSPVFWFASTSAGQQILLEDNKLRGKIEKEALNKIITDDVYGSEKGLSAVFQLALTETGREILRIDPVLREKISQATLNYTIPDGPYQGQSAASALAQHTDGLELLLKTELYNKLTPEMKKKISNRDAAHSLSLASGTSIFKSAIASISGVDVKNHKAQVSRVQI